MWNGGYARRNVVISAADPETSGLEPRAPRPRLFGRPFDPQQPVILPKPLALVRMRVPRGWGVVERRLLNVLLAAAWPWLAREDFVADLSAPCIALRQLLGRHEDDNRALRRALARLVEDDVVFDDTPGFGGPRYYRETPSRILDLGVIEGAMLRWRFTPAVAAVCAAPPVWAKVDLAVCRQLGHAGDLALYEMLAMGMGLTAPFWRLSLADLRADLGAPAGSWTDFRRGRLDKALARVGAVTGWTVRVDWEVERGVRRVERIRFTPVAPAES